MDPGGVRAQQDRSPVHSASAMCHEQHLSRLPAAVGWMASTAAATRSLFWQQLGLGWKMGKMSIKQSHNSNNNSNNSNNYSNNNRLSFSISWTNAERKDNLICMSYTIAKKHVGDL